MCAYKTIYSFKTSVHETVIPIDKWKKEPEVS